PGQEKRDDSRGDKRLQEIQEPALLRVQHLPAHRLRLLMCFHFHVSLAGLVHRHSIFGLRSLPLERCAQGAGLVLGRTSASVYGPIAQLTTPAVGLPDPPIVPDSAISSVWPAVMLAVPVLLQVVVPVIVQASAALAPAILTVNVRLLPAGTVPLYVM